MNAQENGDSEAETILNFPILIDDEVHITATRFKSKTLSIMEYHEVYIKMD